MATTMTKWLFKNFNPIYLANIVLTALVWLVLWYAGVNHRLTNVEAASVRHEEILRQLPVFIQKIDGVDKDMDEVKGQVNDIHKYLLERK